MKKYLMLMAAAVFAFAACEKTPDNGGETDGGATTGSELELYVDMNVQLQHEINTNYGGTTATLPSEEILEFFGLENDEAFYLAMGNIENGGQVNNTLAFGICVKDGDEWIYTFNPSTSSNFGHWMTKEGAMTSWGSADAPHYFFTESQCWWWGYESVDAAIAEPDADGNVFEPSSMWDFTVGIEPGAYDLKVGDKLSATEFIFQEESGKTLYINWNIEIVDAVLRDIKAIETVKTEVTLEYNNTYTAIPLEYDYASIATKLGVKDLFADCEMYPVFADGSYTKTSDIRGWYDANGDPKGHGDDAIMCLEQAGKPVNGLNIFCMPFNPNLETPQTAADKCGTFVCKMAFVAENDNAVILEVKATITEPKPWEGEVVKTYEMEVELTHNNDWEGPELELAYDEIATLLGVKDVLAEAKMLGADKFAATDLYFANEDEVEILNVYITENKDKDLVVIASPVELGEEEEEDARCGTVTGTFYLVNGDKGVQIDVTATISLAEAE